MASAVNVTELPTGCGATRLAPMLVNVSTPPDAVVDGGGVEGDVPDIGYAMLPLEPELS